jgi:hypothetical protein
MALRVPVAMATDPNLDDADVRLWLRLAAVSQVHERELREQRDSIARLVEHGYLEVTGQQVRLLEGRAAA